MSSSSAPLPPFIPPPPTPTNPRIHRSSLISPSPRIKRANHLRRKIPKTLIPKPHYPPPPPPPPEILKTSPEIPQTDASFVEEPAAVDELVHEAEGVVDPFPSAAHYWFDQPVLDLTLRFAALFAVQTVVAVWFLGGGSSNCSGSSNGSGIEKSSFEEREKEVRGEDGEAAELFEMKVLEIRAMAKEVRASEAKDANDGNGGFMSGRRDGGKSKSGRKVGTLGFKGKDRVVPKGFGRLKSGDEQHIRVGNVVFVGNKDHSSHPPLSEFGRKNGGKSKSRRKLRDLGSIGKDWWVPKGFEELKSSDEHIRVGNGGIRRIDHQKPVEESAKMHEQTAPSLEDPLAVGNSSSFLQDTQSVLSFSKSSPTNYIQPENLTDAAQFQNESVQLGTRIEDPESSTRSRNVKYRYESGSQIKEFEGKSILDQDTNGQIDNGSKPWWTKLPYVFAIFLHRGLDKSVQKGLYSLNMNTPEDDGSSPSRIVAFQDRSDATNFCCVLDTFFEDLGDFNADIVPLTIQELNEDVNSGAWKVIIVRKGQLQLYAGQPLADVEDALRSFLD